MPNSATLSRAVDTATKCLAIASFSEASSVTMPRSRRASSSQARTTFAFVMVSSVVKVLEATITRVVSGSRSFVVSPASVGSMLEMKRHSRPSCT